jgi:hypothetical protein
MDADYPEHLLAREPAPPYEGEGPFALWHFSEDPSLGRFRPHEVGGYWVADEPVESVERTVIDDLVGRHASAGIELRVTPSIWPFWRRVVDSTVEFSGSRLGNSAPHQDRFGQARG